MKVEMLVLGSPSLIGRMGFLDVKHRVYLLGFCTELKELCQSKGGRPGVPVPNGPYGLRGRKATFSLNSVSCRSSEAV